MKTEEWTLNSGKWAYGSGTPTQAGGANKDSKTRIFSRRMVATAAAALLFGADWWLGNQGISPSTVSNTFGEESILRQENATLKREAEEQKKKLDEQKQLIDQQK